MPRPPFRRGDPVWYHQRRDRAFGPAAHVAAVFVRPWPFGLARVRLIGRTGTDYGVITVSVAIASLSVRDEGAPIDWTA